MQGAAMELDRLTPVEQALKRRKRIRWLVIAVLVLLGVYYYVFEKTYVIAYDDDRQHFMYGSIGADLQMVLTSSAVGMTGFRALTYRSGLPFPARGR